MLSSSGSLFSSREDEQPSSLSLGKVGLMKEEQRLRRGGPEACGDGVGWGASPCPPASQKQVAGCLWEAGGEEAERLALVGRERRSVAIKVPWDAATGGA